MLGPKFFDFLIKLMTFSEKIQSQWRREPWRCTCRSS